MDIKKEIKEVRDKVDWLMEPKNIWKEVAAEKLEDIQNGYESILQTIRGVLGELLEFPDIGICGYECGHRWCADARKTLRKAKSIITAIGKEGKE